MDLLWKTACSLEENSGDWAEIEHVGKGKEVLFIGEKEGFHSHWVTGIDRHPYKPHAHILSSIRALKVLLTAHLSIMKTYIGVECGCHLMSSLDMNRLHLELLLVEWWCYLLPLINDGLSPSLICLAEVLGQMPTHRGRRVTQITATVWTGTTRG